MVHLELVVAKLVTVVLGLAIAVTAYRGYHRHGAWPMLYLAVGFAIISVGSVVEGIIFEVVVRDIFLAGAIQTVIVAVGMVVVLYSLHANEPLWGIGASRDPPRRARTVDPDERSKGAREGEPATEEREDER